MSYANLNLILKISDIIVKVVKDFYALIAQLVNGYLNRMKVKKEKDLFVDAMIV